MNYAEKRFYNNDDKKYELKDNKEFLNWFLNSLEDGVKPNRYTKLEDFEGLIDSVVRWYELKYPGYILKPYYGNPMADRLSKVRDISSELSGEQFLYRLPHRQRKLMEPDFDCSILYLKGGDRDSFEYQLHFDYKTGIVNYSNIPDFIGLPLEKVLYLLKKNKSSADYSELERVISEYIFKIELRHRLLQLAALKILYKSESLDMGYQTPHMGYDRAKHFIEEFNEEFGFLLSPDEIDELYNDFVLDEKKLKRRARRLKFVETKDKNCLKVYVRK